jgi:UDP-N-acetylglucosamine transferase subunit ALG13
VILVTVGSQMAFDRLIAAVDAWAGRTGNKDVFAQIGPSELEPKNVRWERFIDPDEFRRKMTEADAVVAHAGMGTILSALELGKPILVMPRRGELKETRNDHQVATAQRFLALKRVYVADDADALANWLDRITELKATAPIESRASPELLGVLRNFALHGRLPTPAAAPGVDAPKGERAAQEARR